MDKVIKKKCDICGKIITSLNENQAQYNLDSHKLTHKKEVEK